MELKKKKRVDLKTFSKDDIKMAKKEQEKMLNIINYQRNASQNYNEVSPHTVRMAIIKKPTNNKCWRVCGEKGALLHCWWECKLVQLLMENSMEAP